MATSISTKTIGSVPSLEQICQQQAIQDVLFAHSRGLDRGNTELLKGVYWPDAEVNYGGFKGNAHQFADRIGPVLNSMYELTQHTLGQTSVRIDGAEAKTETYVTARHLLHGAEEEMTFFGRYLDQLQCRNGCWKLIHRHVVMDWACTNKLADERTSDAFKALTKGTRNEQDIAYFLFDKG